MVNIGTTVVPVSGSVSSRYSTTLNVTAPDIDGVLAADCCTRGCPVDCWTVGNQFKVSEAWVKEITTGPQLKPNSPEVLEDFTDELRSCVETLKTCKKTRRN